MSKRFFAALLGAGALAVGALTAGVSGADAAAPHLTHLSGLHAQRVCAKTPAAGHATCFAKVLVNRKGAVPMATAPLVDGPVTDPAARRLQPAPAREAPAGRSRSWTPTATRTLSATSHLPHLLRPAGVHHGERLPEDRDQNGGTSLPRDQHGWAQEQALDVDAVSAACPGCNILVVQAKRASFTDLGTAVDTAATQPGVVAISNSYGGGDARGLDVRRSTTTTPARGDRLDR